MARGFSESTLLILSWLWRLPWACAADIARITGLPANMVSNVLGRRRKAGWLELAHIGRTQPLADRYVFSTDGVKAAHERYGWKIFWWHSATAVRALARRLEVVEMAYKYLPQLWRSNLVTRRSCWVYRERPDTYWRTGEPITRIELEEADWRRGEMIDLHWMEDKPVDLVATYRDGLGNDDLLHLPVLWRGDFQKPSELASVRREMEDVFREDRRRPRLSQDQRSPRDHRPAMLIFSPGRVSAAVAQRNWIESLNVNNATFAAIMDAQGQVVRAMPPLTNWWETFRLPRHDLSLDEVGDVSAAVSTLMTRAYPAVNGVPPWRLFRAVDGSPGLSRDQVVESAGVDPSVAEPLLKTMVAKKVLAVRGRDKGHYLDVSGRGLLADSQRVSRARTNRRWGVYAEKDGTYLHLQIGHNRGQAKVILSLRRHGFSAYPTMGVVIDYWRDGRRVRVAPDAFVVLPPGVLVAVEFERSATSDKDLKDKAEKYWLLDRIGHPMVVLFITETVEAARKLAELKCRYLLATTLDAVHQGPHGRATIQKGLAVGEPGCWWYWYSDREAPTPDAPIDLLSQLYGQSKENSTWRIPLDRPFRRAKMELRMEGGKITFS